MALYLFSIGGGMVKTAWFFILIILTGILENQTQAGQITELKTNLNLLESILDTTLNQLFAKNIIRSDDSVKIKVVADDSIFAVTQKYLVEEKILNKYKITLYTNSDNHTFLGKIITLRWLNWQILYKPVKSKFWQKNNIQRNLMFDFFVEVSSSSESKVLFSRRFQNQYKDIIKKSDMEKTENPNLSFTVGELKQSKGIYTKWLKPVFLFAISATVIYLFYSIRSK